MHAPRANTLELTMMWRIVLAFAVALHTANAAEEVIPGMGHNPKAVGGPETELATKYWFYNVTSRVRPGVDDSPDTQLGYQFMIPLMERLAGITYTGNAARLRLFLERARNGEKLRVSALGGSITAGQGVGGPDHVYLKNFMDWLNMAMPPRSKSRALAAASGAASRALSEEDSGAPQHEYLNGGVPGIQSSYVSSCLKNHLIPNPDLVFIDFAVNDSPLSTWTNNDGAASRRPIERLYRKVLGLPSKPAVVLINLFALGPSGGKYHHTAERDFMEFASYYGMPAISLRAAVLPSAYVDGAKEVYLGDLFNGGWNHPGRGGHAVLVEMLITMCLDLLRTNPQPKASPKSVANDGCDGTNTVTMDMLESVVARELPPPLLEGNFESQFDTCYFDEELPSIVVPPVVGWNWTDEGRGKWGFVTTTKGQTLRLKLNTKVGGKRSGSIATQPILLQLAYLQSYHGMGVAQIECVDGCVCDTVTVDAFDPRPVSVTNIKGLKVTQHSKCVLEVTSVERRGSLRVKASSTEEGAGPGTKFKLMGVVVGEEPGSSEATVSFMRGSTSEIMHRVKDLGR